MGALTGVAIWFVVSSGCVASIPDLAQPSDAASGETEPSDAGEGGAIDADWPDDDASGPCGPGRKLCDQNCVPSDDPSYGCGAPNCAPCDLSHAAAACSAGICVVAACDAPFGDCDTLADNGCEADLSSNALHCGACNRDCGAAACSDSVCEATMLVGNQAGSFSVAVDETHVYWTNAFGNRNLQRVVKSGGTPELLSGSQVASGGQVVLDDTHAYWVHQESGELRRIHKGNLTIELLATGNSMFGLALDDTYAYFTEAGNPGLVGRVLKTGGTIELIAGGLDEPCIPAVDASRAYWTDRDGGGLWVADKTGGPATELGSRRPQGGWGWGLALDSSYVYWLKPKSLARVPKAGGAQMEIASELGSRYMVLYDGVLYWGKRGAVDALVMRLPTADFETALPSVLTVVRTDSAHGITVDYEYVYFTSWTAAQAPEGGVYRVRRY